MTHSPSLRKCARGPNRGGAIGFIPDEAPERALNSYIDRLKTVSYTQDHFEGMENEECKYKLHCKEQ